MKVCSTCGRDDEEVRLIDAISNGEVMKICEECSVTENIPLIRKPSTEQLKDSERLLGVRERLRRMAGLPPSYSGEIRKLPGQITNVSLDDLRKRKTKTDELKEKYDLAKKRNKPMNLVDNYNWIIAMERRKRKITRRQLAEAIGESETAVKMIETRDLPDDADRLISKMQQYLGVKLKKENFEEKRVHAFVRNLSLKENPAIVLKFDKDTTKNISISDLKRMKEERGKVDKEMKKVDSIVWQKNKESEDKEIEDVEKEIIDGEIEFEEEEVK